MNIIKTTDGVEYKASDLAQMSGLNQKTIESRHQRHPEWGLQELIQPSRNPDPVQITHDGKTQSLKAWAEETGVPYSTARERWKKGVRRFDRLFLPYHAGRKTPPARPTVTNAEIEWLEETRYARKGMTEEWEIACDLIGISRFYAGMLQGMMA